MAGDAWGGGTYPHGVHGSNGRHGGGHSGAAASVESERPVGITEGFPARQCWPQGAGERSGEYIAASPGASEVLAASVVLGGDERRVAPIASAAAATRRRWRCRWRGAIPDGRSCLGQSSPEVSEDGVSGVGAMAATTRRQLG